MKLTDLEPRWIHPNLFVVQCPHCVRLGMPEPELLSVKNVQMRASQQFEIFDKELGRDWPSLVVPCRDDFSWTITGTIPSDPMTAFPTNLSVTPSIDASSSGHWHAHITNGEIL